MSKKEKMQNRLNMIWINIISEMQSIVLEKNLKVEKKETLNKIYKQESFKLMQDLHKDVL